MVDTHEFGVMAEYHKIYKVMRDNIWASIIGVQQCAPTIGWFTHYSELQWQCWQPLVV